MDFKKVLIAAKQQLEQAPEGQLWTSKTNGRFQYYRYDGERKYIDKEEAKALAQKKYNELVVKELSKQIIVIEQFQEKYNEHILEEVYEKLPSAIKILVQPHHRTYEQLGEEWVKKDYRSKGIKPGVKVYKTENGEQVRSKSEVIIANKLKAMGLYYRYECPKQIKEYGVLYPDFTVLSPKDKREVIIEHFGMMDIPEYVENFLKKLKTYNMAGIYPGHGLICFFETSEMPLDIEYVEKYLKASFM